MNYCGKKIFNVTGGLTGSLVMLTTVINLGAVQTAAAKNVAATNVQGTAVVQGTVVQGKETAVIPAVDASERTVVQGKKTAKMRPADVQATAAGPDGKTKNRSSFQTIITRNIFQAVEELAGKKEEEKPPPPPRTSLKLTLLGTVLSTEKDGSRAIISDDRKGSADIYYIGDNVQGASIDEIERGKVVFNFNSRQETLLLKDRITTASGTSSGRKIIPPEKSSIPQFDYSDEPGDEVNPAVLNMKVAPMRRITRPAQTVQNNNELPDEEAVEGEEESGMGVDEDVYREDEGESGDDGTVLDEIDAQEAELMKGML